MKQKNKVNRQEISEEQLFESLISDYTSIKQNKILQIRRGNIDKTEFLEDTRKHIDNYYDVSEEVMNKTLLQFEQYIFGYSYLTPLIDNKDITDIRCVSYDNIRIKENGKRKASGIKFSSPAEYRSFIDFIATKNQVSVSNLNAISRFSDTQSSEDFILRFTISMPLVNTYEEPYMHIRKVPKNFLEIPDLIAKKMMSQELADKLVKRFRTGSTLICGGNSSGKTTILNALKETLPHDMAVLVEQQADELTTKNHPDMMFLHSLPKSAESQVEYDLKDISIAALTMDVDFFITGEIKGGEAADILKAADSGQLCAATIHSSSAAKALDKIVDYALHEIQYTKAELMKMLTCFKTIIFMKDFKVDQVYEVTGWNKETQEIEYAPIFERGGDSGNL